MDANHSYRVVFAHDWLTGLRGGEKVLEVLARRWPEAPLFTLLHKRGSVGPAIENRPVHASWFNQLPGIFRYYRYLLPLMPGVVDRWRIPECDLMVSTSHCVAKGARPPEGVPHVCYCFTPVRYAWHLRDAYFGNEKPNLKTRLRQKMLDHLRDWDFEACNRVTHFVGISQEIRRRIWTYYRRPSAVIYPPVDTDFYTPAPVPREEFYLAISAFAPYKRLDLAIEACNRLGRELVIIGTGQDEARLRSLAGPRVHFLGWQPNEVIRDHLRSCKALLFPGEEDFGIVPVEAMATGAPVIALGRGGAAETIRALGQSQEPTGVFFHEQTAESLVEAILKLESRAQDFSPAAARRQSLGFTRQRFATEIFAFLDRVHQGATEAELTSPPTAELRQAG